MANRKAFRGEILHFFNDPSDASLKNIKDSYEHLDDGILSIEDGLIKDCLPFATVQDQLDPDVEIVHYQDGLITPGFIDTHIHYPQTEVIASPGEQLLSWLETYTFPAESQFSDYNYAKTIAEFFLNELINHGTTTAQVFGTVHPQSVDAFFDAALKKNLRMICGKVLMDRNAPGFILDTADTAYEQSKTLIEKWHNKARLRYAVTPRFAVTSTPEQLMSAGRLLKEYPDVHLHTHLSENKEEIAWVNTLFPESEGYLDVYDQYGLLGRQSVFAHGVHLTDKECARLAQTGSSIAHCPSSNLFLGSGLFNLQQAESHGYNVALGTDVGGGTSFSLLHTISDAYKSQQLAGHYLHALKSFYLATLGGAKALNLDQHIGSFQPGREADFIVLDYKATALMQMRLSHCQSLEEKLFVLSTLGDDRTILATHILGEKVK